MGKCRLLHDWGSWQDITLVVRPALNNGPLQGTVTIYGEPTEVNGQKKVCKRCGKKKTRIV